MKSQSLLMWQEHGYNLATTHMYNEYNVCKKKVMGEDAKKILINETK